MNTGGWWLLTVIFSALLLTVQRVERKRRNAALIILGIVGFIVARYAIYRMESDCALIFPIVCHMGWIPQQSINIAYNTLNLAILSALVFNLFFWVLIGRSNPPGSSDSITVIGPDDDQINESEMR